MLTNIKYKLSTSLGRLCHTKSNHIALINNKLTRRDTQSTEYIAAKDVRIVENGCSCFFCKCFVCKDNYICRICAVIYVSNTFGRIFLPSAQQLLFAARHQNTQWNDKGHPRDMWQIQMIFRGKRAMAYHVFQMGAEWFSWLLMSACVRKVRHNK